MKVISIISLIVIFIYGVLTMRASSFVSESDDYKILDKLNKQVVIGKVKLQWKVTIICLAVIVVMLLITLGTFMGNTHNYENVISIGSTIIGAILLLAIIMNKKNFDKEVKGIFSKE